MLLPEVIYARKNYFLLDELNKHIENLKAAGLIELWHKQNFNIKQQDERPGLKALSLDDFRGCFYLFLCGVLSSLAVFCGEALIACVNRRK
jgi:hypothetical protein